CRRDPGAQQFDRSHRDRMARIQRMHLEADLCRSGSGLVPGQLFGDLICGAEVRAGVAQQLVVAQIGGAYWSAIGATSEFGTVRDPRTRVLLGSHTMFFVKDAGGTRS